MKGWKAHELSEEGEDNEVEMRDFCKTRKKWRLTTRWKE